LLQDGVVAVPQGERQAQPLLVVTDPGQAVFPPAVGPAARVIVWEVRPGVPVRAVVLADRAPLAFTQVRSPPAPRLRAEAVLLQTLPFGAAGRGAHDSPMPSARGPAGGHCASTWQPGGRALHPSGGTVHCTGVTIKYAQ